MKKGILIGTVAGMLTGAAVWMLKNRKIVVLEGKVQKFKKYYAMLNEWLSIRQEGSSLARIFAESGYKEIAIYGMGEMGQRLYEELKDTDIVVKYAVDQNAAFLYSELDLKKPEEDLEPVDAVIVTAVFDFDKIKGELAGRVNSPVVSLEEFI